MKVKLKQSMAGPSGGWRVGELKECDPEEAKRLIAAGIAEPVKSRREKAVTEESEDMSVK